MSVSDPRPPVVSSPALELREHAAFRAHTSTSGIGAGIVRSGLRDGEHFWECVVSNGHEWHYVQVLGRDLGRFQLLAAPEIERGIERFAARLPAQGRLWWLINANPLHIDRGGTVDD
jgi:hypothetical protein